MTRWRPSWLLAALTLTALVLPPAARAQDDAGVAGPSFKEGDVITLDQVDKLKPFLPPSSGPTGTSSSTRA